MNFIVNIVLYKTKEFQKLDTNGSLHFLIKRTVPKILKVSNLRNLPFQQKLDCRTLKKKKKKD